MCLNPLNQVLVSYAQKTVETTFKVKNGLNPLNQVLVSYTVTGWLLMAKNTSLNPLNQVLVSYEKKFLDFVGFRRFVLIP